MAVVFHPAGRPALALAPPAAEMLTRTLAVTEAPHGITVNGVSPGTLDNSERKPPLERIPAGRFGTAEEVARAVLFLADPASGYITGTNIKVSGGYLI